MGCSGYVAVTGKKSSASTNTPRFYIILKGLLAPACSTFQKKLFSMP
jgi:hypothetical protein